MSTNPFDEVATERARKFLGLLIDDESQASTSQTFDTTALQGLRNISSRSPGHVYCELLVSKPISNIYGNLHGGATATIIDTVGSAAIATVSEKGGVSVHISADYLTGLPTGEVVAVDAQVMSVGKRLVTVQVKLTNHKSGRLIATGMHTKYLTDWEPPLRFGTPPKLVVSKL